MPAALLADVPNPFFGIAGTGEFGRRATIQAGQLLRPFPQFGDVFEFERTAGGKRQYHAATVVLDKRIVGRWGGRLSYTWSSTKDNQFGQDNTYLTRTALPQNNYDLDAEYGISNFDSPHRIILAPIFRFPDGGNIARRDGWNASAVVELVSGAPLNAVLSAGASTANLGLFGGRQRPNLIGDPNTSGSDNDRVSFEGQEAARYFNAGAFANPGRGHLRQCATRHRRRALPVPEEHRPRHRQGHDAFGNHAAQVRFEILNLTNTRKVPRHRLERDHRSELRAYHAAGRIHADLAAEFPLHVLDRQRRAGRPFGAVLFLGPQCRAAVVAARRPRRAGRRRHASS